MRAHWTRDHVTHLLQQVTHAFARQATICTWRRFFFVLCGAVSILPKIVVAQCRARPCLGQISVVAQSPCRRTVSRRSDRFQSIPVIPCWFARGWYMVRGLVSGRIAYGPRTDSRRIPRGGKLPAISWRIGFIIHRGRCSRRSIPAADGPGCYRAWKKKAPLARGSFVSGSCNAYGRVSPL